MAAAVKIYVQETFADIEDEFCDADSVADMEEVVEEQTIQVDVNNQIYHGDFPFNETVEVDEVEYEFVHEDAFRFVVHDSSNKGVKKIMPDDTSWSDNEDDPHLQASVKRKTRGLFEATHNVYECEECDYKSTRRSNLIRHIKSTHNLDRMECDHCGAHFIDLCSLKRHIRTAHESVIYKCSHCEFKSTRADTLKEHTNVVHFNVRFVCQECDHQATSKRALRRHAKAKHFSSLKNVDPVQVSDHDNLKNMRLPSSNAVNKKGDDPSDYVQGVVKMVWGQPADTATEVPKGNIKLNYEGQNFTFSTVEKPAVESAHYRCDKCDYSNKRRNKLSEHIKSAHERIRYECTEKDCSFISASKFNLKRHVASIHQGVKFKCPYEGCDYKISQSPHLQAHIKAKHKNQKFKCDVCSFECFTPHGLRQHKKAEHDGIRYKCHLCHYKATQMSNLRTHIRKIHTDKKQKSVTAVSLISEMIVPDL